MKKPHISYFIYDAKKWLIILFFPIIRAVFFRDDVVSLVFSSLRDIALALILIGYSFLKWKQTKFSFEKGFYYEYGIFFRKKLYLPLDDASSITIERTPLMWLTGGRRIQINTAGVKSKSDATIYAHKSIISGREIKKNKEAFSYYSARFFPVIILCISSSNAALGLLTLAPMFRQASDILGDKFAQNIYNMYSSFETLVSLGLPPLLNSVGNIFIVGWAFSFVTTFVRYARFHAQRTGDRIFITSGLITRRDIYIESLRVTTIELRQTLFMRAAGLFTASITAAGYGREKDSKPVIIPAARAKELEKTLHMLLPDYPTTKASLIPHKKAVFVYIYRPIIIILLSFLPLMYGGVWAMLFAVFFTLGLWWLTVSIISFRETGFGVSEEAVSMKYSRGLALYQIQVPREVVDSVKITQSIFQRRSNSCNVQIKCFSEKRRKHIVRSLPYNHAIYLAQKLG